MPALKSLLKKSPKKVATIKGIFVQSHIEALRRKKGEQAVAELEQRFGASVNFGRFEDVPIRDEVRLIEHALDLSDERGLSGAARSEAAGALHFNNFASTTLGRALMYSMPHTAGTFRTMLHNSPSIARTVFLNSEFRCEDDEGALIITISNCDYPAEHFKGFFEEWMRFWGILEGSVRPRVLERGMVEYRLLF